MAPKVQVRHFILGPGAPGGALKLLGFDIGFARWLTALAFFNDAGGGNFEFANLVYCKIEDGGAFKLCQGMTFTSSNGFRRLSLEMIDPTLQGALHFDLALGESHEDLLIRPVGADLSSWIAGTTGVTRPPTL